MSHAPPSADFNPFEAPRTRIGAGPDGDVGEAERTRREYLGRESSVRSIAWVFFLGAALLGLALTAATALLLRRLDEVLEQGMTIEHFIGPGIVLLLIAALVTLGIGLNRLRPWARWLALAPVGFATFVDLLMLILGVTSVTETTQPRPLTIAAAGLLLLPCGHALYLLVSSAGGVVCSRPYRGVIEQTPHLRRGMSPFLWTCLSVSFGLIVMGVLALMGRAWG